MIFNCRRANPALFLLAFALLGCDHAPPRPNDAAVIQSAIEESRYPSEFQQLFPSAEHEISLSKREFPDGWKQVDEWNSRASLYDRYVIELRVAIRIDSDGTVSELESPSFYLGEVTEVWRNDADKLSFRLGDGHSLQEDDWRTLVDSTGDFSTLGIDLRSDAPVKNFATYWRETR